MAKDNSFSAKKNEQIQAIEATDDQLTTKACLSFWLFIELNGLSNNSTPSTPDSKAPFQSNPGVT